jgi:hypothetical protein
LQLHKPTSNLTLYHKRVHYVSIKIFNELREYIAEFAVDTKHFI